MNEQVLVYEIKASAKENAEKLFSADKKYFYWSADAFKSLNIGDFVFVVNKHARYVLFAKLDKVNIRATTTNGKSAFSDFGKRFSLEGEWQSFVRLEVLSVNTIPESWGWKSLRNSEVAYLNRAKFGPMNAANRMEDIIQLKKLSKDELYNDVLDACIKNFIDVAAGPKTSTKTPQEIVSHAHKYITSLGFRYQPEEIANFYLALRAKPFVILAGISGTGKTQLPRKFAEALGFSERVTQLPVRPDWTDGSDLLGYTSLDGKFIPKNLTIAIQKAAANPGKPYFFILDEMNLARVEHYFSDFLSVIETRKEVDGKITTDPMLREEMLRTAKNKGDFSAMGWPENLFLIGTVNMDETTHAFSRKVLDRANSIEMNEIDLDWVEADGSIVKALQDISNDLFKSSYLSAENLSARERSAIAGEMDLLKQVNKILQKADLHFAYRVRDEIAFYLTLNKKYKLMSEGAAFDFQLVQKILPRIHGSSERIQAVLIDLFNLLEDQSFRSSDFESARPEEKIIPGNLKYKRASSKIIFMLKRFNDDRFTSFWL